MKSVSHGSGPPSIPEAQKDSPRTREKRPEGGLPSPRENTILATDTMSAASISAKGSKRPASKSPTPEQILPQRALAPPQLGSFTSRNLSRIRKTTEAGAPQVGAIYTDGRRLSPADSSFRGWNGDKHWKKRMKQQGVRELFRAVGIFNKDQYKAEAARISSAPTSDNVPGFVRKSDMAIVRYDKGKNFFLVVDARGAVITMFMPDNGLKTFEDEHKKI